MPRAPPHQLTPGCRLLVGLVAGGGERLATAMLYLSAVQWGGNTVFPQLGLSVTPEVGAVIMITVVIVIMNTVVIMITVVIMVIKITMVIMITLVILAIVQERAALVWVNIKSDGTFDTRSCHAGNTF